MKLFISHINEESNLALTLKEWIESSFAGQCDVFVSSDKDDIPAGSKWLEAIDNALGEAVGLIVLCSPVSLARPWINFETGCGWIKRVPIIPICHSGQKKAALPPPISMFQALEIEEEEFVNDLLSGLAKHLKFSKIPRIDQNSMRRELLSAATTVKPDTVSATARVTSSTQDEIPQEAVDILKVLSQVSGIQPSARELAGHFNMTEQRTQYFLDLLIKNKVVYRSLYSGSPSTYSLSPQGRKYLFDRGLL
jgi:hypothetical protein